MSVLDIGSKVLIAVQADTSQARAELKNLEGAERDAAKASIEAAEAKNKSLDGYVEKLGHVGLALNTVQQVMGFAHDALKTYGDDLRLEAAAGATNIDALSDAFDGLVNRHELLTFAAKTAHGALALNQDQQETLAKATIALTHAGFDQNEVMEKLEDAAISLKTRGLHELGIEVEQSSDQHQTLTNLMGALNEKIKDNSALVSTEADDVQRLVTAWDNAKESFMGYVGATLSWDAATHGKGAVFDVANVFSLGSLSWALDQHVQDEAKRTTDEAYQKIADDLDHDLEDSTKTADVSVLGALANIRQGLKTDPWTDPLLDKFQTFMTKAKKDYDAAKERWKQIEEQRKALSNQVAKSLTDELQVTLQKQVDAINTSSEFADQRDFKQKLLGDIGLDLEKELDAKAPAKAPTLMEKLFGKTEEIDRYKIALSAVGEVAKGMADSAAAGLDAMILGSQSGAKAFTQSLGQMLHGLAVKEMTQGFVETGEGIAALFVDPPAAPGHFAAAATYEAIGVAADLAAKELGFGGGSSSSKASGGGGSSGAAGPSNTLTVASSGDQGQGQRIQIFVVGDPAGGATGSSPRMLQVQQDRIKTLVSGTTGVAFK